MNRKRKNSISALESAETNTTKIKKNSKTNDSNNIDIHLQVKYLIKSEPDDISLDDVRNSPNLTMRWDGIRNYQARNICRTMKYGDYLYYYHSNAKKETGIVGIVQVVSKEYYEDPTAFDPSHKLFDAKAVAKGINPWVSFDIKFIEKFEKPLFLTTLKKLLEDEDQCPLKKMMLFHNTRLSCQLVSKEEAEYIHNLL